MKLNRIALTGAAGMMGLGLIGVGAHAAFTTTTQSHQQVSAGYLNVVLQANTATVTAGNTTNDLVLKAISTVPSSFTTGTKAITIRNIGSVTARFIKAIPSASYTPGTANAALANAVYMCEVSTGEVIYNGPLHSAPAQTIGYTLAPGETTSYVVNVYAGKAHTACGTVTGTGATAVAGTSTAPSLNNTAEGGVINTNLKVTYQG